MLYRYKYFTNWGVKNAYIHSALCHTKTGCIYDYQSLTTIKFVYFIVAQKFSLHYTYFYS